jgi:segregation and condensation protein B
VQFLDFFNLKDLASLPTLREFQELTEENREIVEKETGPAEEAKGTEGLVADLADKKLEERLQASTTEADAALADLETALADTDSKSKATARVLNPLPPPPASPDGTPPPAAPAPAAEDDGEAEDEQDDGEGEGEPPAA